mgnify:CR=1 FL=1
MLVAVALPVQTAATAFGRASQQGLEVLMMCLAGQHALGTTAHLRVRQPPPELCTAENAQRKAVKALKNDLKDSE